MNGWVDDSGWIHCPTCGNKTRTKIHADTVLRHFPLFCPKCRREHLVDVNRKQIIIVEPDAEPMITRIFLTVIGILFCAENFLKGAILWKSGVVKCA